MSARPSELESAVTEVAAFLRRRLAGDYPVDEFGFDPDLTENVMLPALRPLYEQWFRVETIGVENVPADGGALLVANHSGTLPLDALMTVVAMHDDRPTPRNLRMLAADLVFGMPGFGAVARKAGHTLACTPDAERLLGAGELVGVWPEGFKGIGKAFADRYKLQRFGRGGFVSAALRTGVPIIPLLDRRRRGDLPDDRRPRGRSPGCSACRTSRSRRRSRCSVRSGSCRCPRSGTSSSASRSGPTSSTRRRRRPDAGLQPHRPGARDIQQTLYRLLSGRRNAFLG